MINNNPDYKKIAEQISNLEALSHQESWATYYEKDFDALYISPEVIDKRYSLLEIGDEMMVYIDENSNLGGIFIEYFRNNLASHNKKYKPFKKLIGREKKLSKDNETLLLSTVEASLLEVLVPKVQVSVKA